MNPEDEKLVERLRSVEVALAVDRPYASRTAAIAASAISRLSTELQELRAEIERTKRHHNPSLAFILGLAPGTEIVVADVPAETRKQAFNALSYSVRRGITERPGYGHYRRAALKPETVND